MRTLLGTIKYFRRYNGGKNKKFLYEEDYNLIQAQIKKYKLDSPPSTIDKQIMDLADEIAYGAHDLEDCLSIGYFTVDELLHEFYYSDEYKGAYDHLQKLIQSCREFAGKAERLKSSEEYVFLFRRRLTAVIIHTLVIDIQYSEADKELVIGTHSLLSEGLKRLTFKAVLRKPSIRLYEKKGEKVIRGLFEVYTDESYNEDLILLPPEYRHYTNDLERKRNIIDFISGMMDSYAVQEYERYFGQGSLERLYFNGAE